MKFRAVRVAAGGGRCRVTAGVRAARRAAGMGQWVRVARDAGGPGIRTRQPAWRWVLDLRVAHCCLEHDGQYSGPGAADRDPRQPAVIPQVKDRRPR